ncbi:Na+-dependent transporter [Bradyrhizobium sp. SSBR45G]|uniref:Na+-dependent transporter n=1 Tax=unclassified Bradyrhizobium TaxID=2631580 RepID=UPI0023429EDC|nr:MULTISPECIES: Na+-dependent transporter [unclassified Bradyrhizobium]GLH75218.1 Na+-dependent transporter [Bradyrhizobium sp. SSBR45G]GLH82995.1 Na+-dependent transporter [Bradyrhizobium sp. SSBR45R]
MPSSRPLALPLRALSWLGNQGTRAIVAVLLAAIAVPPLGELARPYVTHAIFLLLCISFMRVDVAMLRAHLRRPALVLVATAWTTIAVPALVGALMRITGLDAATPDLHLALMLQATASPMMASPALAALMGLDATLVLITLVTSTALVPLTAPLFAYMFLGQTLSLSPAALGLKLAGILAAALIIAVAIRLVFGIAAIRRHRAPIDGCNILILFVFASAIMAHFLADLIASPFRMLGLAVLAFAVFFLLLGITMLLFRGAGRERAMALGLMVSLRNMGLMLAATDGAIPGTTWLYFAMSQFPIHLAPQLLRPLVERLRSQPLPSGGTDHGLISPAPE